MSRKRKRLLLALAFIGVVLPLVYFIALPAIVHWRLMAALRDAGLTRTSFKVSSVGLFRSAFTQVEISDGVSARRLVVEYSPSELLSGRVTAVCIDGLHLSIECKDGRFGLGAVDEIIARSRKSTTQPTTNTALGSDPLPFDRIELTDSVVSIKAPGNEVILPISGALTFQIDQSLMLDAVVTGDKSPIRVSGNFDSTHKSNALRAQCDSLDVASLSAVLKCLAPSVDVSLTGNAAAEVRYAYDSAGHSLDVTILPRALVVAIPKDRNQVSKLQLDKGVLLLDATWNDDVEPFIEFTAADVSIASAANDAQADGIACDFAYGPGSETVLQRMNIRNAKIGQMQVSDGVTTFKIDGGHVVHIARTRWDWLGGTLAASDVTIAPGLPTDVTIAAGAIELKPLLEQFGSGHVSGEGRVDLSLPMRIDWPRIGFGRGSVRNAGPGRLSIAQASNFADAVAGSDTGKEDQQAKLKQDVVEALRDFDFRVLDVSLRPDESTLSADVHLAGMGRTGAKKSLDLELHLTKVDDLIEFYLGVAGKLAGQ